MDQLPSGGQNDKRQVLRIIFSLFPSAKTNLVASNFLFAHFNRRTVEHTEEPWSLTWIHVDSDDMMNIKMELSVPPFARIELCCSFAVCQLKEEIRFRNTN